jgi:hypothetical protein
MVIAVGCDVKDLVYAIVLEFEMDRTRKWLGHVFFVGLQCLLLSMEHFMNRMSSVQHDPLATKIGGPAYSESSWTRV